MHRIREKSLAHFPLAKERIPRSKIKNEKRKNHPIFAGQLECRARCTQPMRIVGYTGPLWRHRTCQCSCRLGGGRCGAAHARVRGAVQQEGGRMRRAEVIPEDKASYFVEERFVWWVILTIYYLLCQSDCFCSHKCDEREFEIRNKIDPFSFAFSQ